MLRLHRIGGGTGNPWDSVQQPAQPHLFPGQTLACYPPPQPLTPNAPTPTPGSGVWLDTWAFSGAAAALPLPCSGAVFPCPDLSGSDAAAELSFQPLMTSSLVPRCLSVPSGPGLLSQPLNLTGVGVGHPLSGPPHRCEALGKSFLSHWPPFHLLRTQTPAEWSSVTMHSLGQQIFAACGSTHLQPTQDRSKGERVAAGQQHKAAKGVSLVSGSSLRGLGVRTMEGMSCFGELPPLGSKDNLEDVQRRQTKLDRSPSTSCEV